MRGENFSSADDTVTAVKYLLSSKEAKLKELENIVLQLQQEEESLKKMVQKKQTKYQKEMEKKEQRTRNDD